MKPDRWQEIERIYHSALELEEGQRTTFLENACGGDETLRHEVESLLRSEQSEDRFIEVPALEMAVKMFAQEEPQSLLGQQLGSYQVLSLLGRVVWGWSIELGTLAWSASCSPKILSGILQRQRQKTESDQ
jgi:serine/threonine-protein kinase